MSESLASLGAIANLFVCCCLHCEINRALSGPSRTDSTYLTSRQRLWYLSQSMYALVAYVGAVVQYSHEGYVVILTFSSSLHATEGQRCIVGLLFLAFMLAYAHYVSDGSLCKGQCILLGEYFPHKALLRHYSVASIAWVTS